jgi:hypothetical protein
VRHPLYALAAAVGFVALALLGGRHRHGAVLGAALSGLAGVGSVFAMGALARFGAGAARPTMLGALAVMAGGFLVRILLVAVGVFAVVRTGESVPGFVVGFFVPFFVLVVIEAVYAHHLGRGVTP